MLMAVAQWAKPLCHRCRIPRLAGVRLQKQPVVFLIQLCLCMPDYNPAKEARLLQYNNASNEVLVDVTRYALDGDADKYIKMGYSTYLNLEPVIRIRDGCGDFGSGGFQALLNKSSVLIPVEEWKRLIALEPYLTNRFFHDSTKIQHILEPSFKDDLSVRNISRTGDISTDVKIYYNWEHTKGL
ncbi:hypothetical protein FQA39_LY11849 [Lamprigera yunnana]|nr:hypothetical protein FQA39_LY11849 [Lamprigera yunnana]